jgi:hypothetical protein
LFGPLFLFRLRVSFESERRAIDDRREQLADLVLLEGNPIENIGNTKRIQAIVVRGNLIPKSKLDENAKAN